MFRIKWSSSLRNTVEPCVAMSLIEELCLFVRKVAIISHLIRDDTAESCTSCVQVMPISNIQRQAIYSNIIIQWVEDLCSCFLWYSKAMIEWVILGEIEQDRHSPVQLSFHHTCILRKHLVVPHYAYFRYHPLVALWFGIVSKVIFDDFVAAISGMSDC